MKEKIIWNSKRIVALMLCTVLLFGNLLGASAAEKAFSEKQIQTMLVNVQAVFEKESYLPGEEVKVTLIPEEGCALTEDKIQVWSEENLESVAAMNEGIYTVSFLMPEKEVWIKAEAKCAYESTEQETNLVMPAEDEQITLEEMEAYNKGDLSAEDTELGEDIGKDHQVTTGKEYEPDVFLGKSAKWEDIEEGTALLTLTQRSTSDWSDNPSDYIIVLDRTVSMVVDYTKVYGTNKDDLGFASSVCLNPEHYYKYNGQKVSLIDYGHGYYTSSGKYFSTESYMGNLEEIWNEHYDASGKKIAPRVYNGCTDRLTIAQNSIKDILDVLEKQNQKQLDGGLKNRVMYWSFSGSNDLNNGLWNEVPEFTEDMTAVKNAVKYEAYPGTYFYRSFEQILNKLNEKQKDQVHKDVPTKVIFISDGILYDKNPDEITKLADKIKKMANTKIYTILIGDSKDSEAGKVLEKYASGSECFATVTSDWNVFVNTLTAIQQDQFEIKATEKVVTDQIDTRYWEVIGDPILEKGNGTAVFDENKTILTWKLPEEAEKTYTCKVRLKLKDEYRYLVSDTVYPTNADAPGADEEQILADPSKAGAVIEYQISGGKYNGESRSAGVRTPELKYGAVSFEGTKHWTVAGSNAEKVEISLKRKMPGASELTEINNTITNAAGQWKYSFSVRQMPDGTTYPLIKYNNAGQEVEYQVEESVPEYYQKIDEKRTEENGVIVTEFFNEPAKMKVQVEKVDAESDNPLSGAEFSVYSWSEKAGKYVPYLGTADSVDGAERGMKLKEEQKGIYISPVWLYYSTDNGGKFRVIETKAPEGYFGDWKDPEVTATQQDKNVYDFEIGKDQENNGKTVTISNRKDQKFENHRVTGTLRVTKEGEFLTDAKQSVIDQVFNFVKTTFEYLLGRVENVTFGVYVREDILSPDGSGEIASWKNAQGQMVELKKNMLVEQITTDRKGNAVIEGLPLGKYYVKELSAGTQGDFLLNQEIQEAELVYFDESDSVVYPTKERVMTLSDFYYVNERQKVQITLEKYELDQDDEKIPLEGVLFGLYTAEDIYGYEIDEEGCVSKNETVLLQKDTLVETAESDAYGNVKFVSELPCAKYYVKEIRTAEGYLESSEVFEADASYTGKNGDEILKFHFEAENKKTEVFVRKTDLQTGDDISGAKLIVTEKSSGETVCGWQTDGTVKKLEGLKLSKDQEEYIYILKETEPAAGYVTAEEIEFKLIQMTDADGKYLDEVKILIYEKGEWKALEENVIEMKDDVTKVEIRKGDQKTKKLLSGAKLELRNSDGKIMYSWISSEKQGFYAEGLPIGLYRIVETEKMNGYQQADPMVIEVADTGKTQVFVFENIPENAAEKSEKTETPQSPSSQMAVKTGDYAPIAVCAVMMFGSLAGLGITKKRKNK